MNLRLLGLGTALPATSADQEQALAVARQLWTYTPEEERTLTALYRRSGVQRRYSVLKLPDGAPLRPAGEGRGEPPATGERMRFWLPAASRLAVEAAREALRAAELPPQAITHLVTVSCTGAAAPGFDFALMRALELGAGTERTHVGFMGCHGALNGLRVARGLGAADPRAAVLVCAVELCSLHFHYGTDPEQMVANALFADGAAAAVGAPAAHAGEKRSGQWEVAANGACLIPDSEDAMTWNIGDRGFLMTLSARVPALIQEHLRPWLDRWLAGLGLTRRDVRSFAVHPGGPRILGAVEASLELDERSAAVSRDVLARHGNMSSPTLLFILRRLIEAGAETPCVALGFGPGLAVEAALLR